RVLAVFAAIVAVARGVAATTAVLALARPVVVRHNGRPSSRQQNPWLHGGLWCKCSARRAQVKAATRLACASRRGADDDQHTLFADQYVNGTVELERQRLAVDVDLKPRQSSLRRRRGRGRGRWLCAFGRRAGCAGCGRRGWLG